MPGPKRKRSRSKVRKVTSTTQRAKTIGDAARIGVGPRMPGQRVTRETGEARAKRKAKVNTQRSMRRRGPIKGGALPAPGNIAVGVGRVLGGIFTRKAALPRMAGTPRAAPRAPSSPAAPKPPSWETRPTGSTRPPGSKPAWINRQAKDLTNYGVRARGTGVRAGGVAGAPGQRRAASVKRVMPRDTSPKPTVIRAVGLKRRPSQRASFR